MFRFKSIETTLLIIVIALILVIMGGLLTVHGLETYGAQQEELVQKRDRVLQSQSVILARAVLERDEVQVTLQAAPVLVDPDITGIFVFTADDKPVATFGTRDPLRGEAIIGSEPIRYAVDGELRTVGRVDLVLTDARVRETFEGYLRTMLMLALILTVAVVVAMRLSFSMVIGQPLRRLLDVIDRTEQGAARESVPWTRDDEIGRLIQAFNALQERQSPTRRNWRRLRKILSSGSQNGRRNSSRPGTRRRARAAPNPHSSPILAMSFARR